MRLDLRYLLGASRFIKPFTELFTTCDVPVYSETLKKKKGEFRVWLEFLLESAQPYIARPP